MKPLFFTTKLKCIPIKSIHKLQLSILVALETK